MTAFSNIPPQAVLPLGAYDQGELHRAAERSGQRLLQADCSCASDRDGVFEAIARGFALPPHFGRNLDALYDCLTDLSPGDADPPGFVVVLRGLPEGPGFDAEARDALLDVFRDAADHFFDAGVAFRVFYSVDRARAAPPR